MPKKEKERNSQPRLARNFVANLLRFAFVIGVSFFLSPFVVQKLGATGFGVWSLAMGLLGYLALLDFGIRQAVNRFIAHYHAVGDHDESILIVSTALKLFAILGIFALVLSVVLAYFASALFNIPNSLLDEMRVIVVLGGMTVCISLFSGVFGGIVTGVQRFDVQCVLDIVATAVRAVGTVIVLVQGYGLIALALVQLGASFLSLLGYQFAAHALYPELRVSLRFRTLSHAKLLLAFAASSFGIYMLSVLSFQSGAIIIGVILPIKAVTFYAIAANLVLQANGLTDALAHIMTPRISAIASRDSSLVAPQIVTVAKITMLMIGPVAITFFVRGESFIGLWMGDEFAALSGSVLGVLAIVLWQGAVRSVAVSSLTGIGKQGVLIPGFLVEALANISLSIALIKPFGVYGVALGAMIPNVIITLVFIPYCLEKSAGVPRSLLYLKVVLLPVLSCVPFAVFSSLVERHFPASNLVMFFAQVVVLLPLVPAIAWFLCFSSTEQNEIRKAISSIVEKS